MYNPSIIANFFLAKSLSTGIPVTPMKLLKLVYLSHGWYLGYSKEPLISEAVKAWPYGPVILSLYERVKKYGNKPIAELIDFNSDGKVGPEEFPTGSFVHKILESVWNTYKNYTGLQLSDLTHRADSPWDKTIKESGVYSVIPYNYIQDYYERLVNAQQPAQPAAG